MNELLYLIIAVFVGYAVYVAVREQKATTSQPSASPAKPEKPVAAVKAPTPQPAPKKAADTKPPTAIASQSGPAKAPQDAGKRGLKDPATGEVTAPYSNYRFTKRWIKEALVSEKLLDKVYKNDELTADIEAKIKSAVATLGTIEKYRA
jgi:hypothetical protein